MPGRIIERWARAYIDGVDWSPYVTKLGNMGWSYATAELSALADAGNGVLPDMPTVSLGDIQAELYTGTPTGYHDQASAVPATRVVSFPFGVGAVPGIGDPAFVGQFIQRSYIHPVDKGISLVDMSFGLPDVTQFGATSYTRPWGIVTHPKGAETGVNAANAYDCGAATAFGGCMVYHLFSSNGTVTLKMQDNTVTTGASCADITGMTTGAIDASTTPKSGIIGIAKTAIIRQFVRWQLVLGTATTATFFLALVRPIRDNE
jgi:hypothetical protein